MKVSFKMIIHLLATLPILLFQFLLESLFLIGKKKNIGRKRKLLFYFFHKGGKKNNSENPDERILEIL